MNQRNNFQEDEAFFDTATVNTAQPVMPLVEMPTTSSPRFRRLRVPMRHADNSFNKAFFAVALLAVTALGTIAGVLLYRTSGEKPAGDAPEETVNRSIQPQYQFIVEKPDSQPVSKDDLPPSAPVKKTAPVKQETSVPAREQERESVSSEEVIQEDDRDVISEEEVEPPPIRDRKQDKKREKAERKNKREKTEDKNDEEIPVDDGGVDDSY